MSPWSAVYYEPLLAELSKDRLAIAVDTPGYGNSDAPPGPPSMEDYGAAMTDVIDALGLGEFDLLGDRTGAKVAIEVARIRSEQARRIILVSPVVWTEEERRHRKEFPAEVIREDGSHLVNSWLVTVGMSMSERTLDMIGRIFYARHIQLKTANWGRHAAANYKAREALDSLTQPIKVLRPRDELWNLTSRVAEHLNHPASHVHDLPDWGYGFLEVHVAKTAELIRDFLDPALTTSMLSRSSHST